MPSVGVSSEKRVPGVPWPVSSGQASEDTASKEEKRGKPERQSEEPIPKTVLWPPHTHTPRASTQERTHTNTDFFGERKCICRVEDYDRSILYTYMKRS